MTVWTPGLWGLLPPGYGREISVVRSGTASCNGYWCAGATGRGAKEEEA